MCADLGLNAKKAQNLRRQLTLPAALRELVSEHAGADRISPTMANRLAGMLEVAPALTDAVAERITSKELHDQAISDLGAFVHRTMLEKPDVYAVRLDEGAMLDAAQQITHARGHLNKKARQQLAGLMGCTTEKLDKEIDTLHARATGRTLKIRVSSELRERAQNGRYAFTHERGQDFAAGVWVVDPVFMLEVVHSELKKEPAEAPARDEAFFAGAGLHDEDMKEASEQDRAHKRQLRERQEQARSTNTGLGMDIRAGLMEPQDSQMHALKAVVCHVLADQYRELIAYGAGWTDPERQQPVGDSGGHEPRQAEAIITAELARALEDPDALRGIGQLAARLGAAFMLDPEGVTRTDQKAWGASFATRCPAASPRYAPRSGSSYAQCSHHGWWSKTATASCSTASTHPRRPQRPPLQHLAVRPRARRRHRRLASSRYSLTHDRPPGDTRFRGAREGKDSILALPFFGSLGIDVVSVTQSRVRVVRVADEG